MKKVIDGKRYNSETATEIAQYGNVGDTASSSRDFKAYNERLYLTKSGNWFLCGSGGPMTKYARLVGGNSWSDGSGIFPLSSDEAREWLEAHDQAALEEHFANTLQDA